MGNPEKGIITYKGKIVGKILKTKELAEYLKLTKVTVYKYANQGKIPGFKIGKSWRFDQDKIDQLLERTSLPK